MSGGSTGDDAAPLGRAERALAASAALLLACVLAVVCIPFPDAHPVYDDFTRGGAAVRRTGALAAMADEYMRWSGRWASMAVEYAVQASDRFRDVYWLTLVVANAALVGALAFAVRSWFRECVSRAGSVVVAALLFAMLWGGAPSVAEGFYWHTGVVENQLPFTIAILVAGGLVRVARSGRPPGTGATAALAFGAFWATGHHELWGLVFTSLFALGAVVAWRTGSPARRTWLVVAAASLAALVPNVFSPGNSARGAMEGVRARTSEARSVSRIGYFIVSQAKRTAFAWAPDVRLALGAAGLALLACGARTVPGWTTSRRPWRWAAVALWAGVLACGLAAATWAIARRLPLRTMNGLHIVYVTGACAVAVLFAVRLRDRTAAVRPALRAAGWACVAASAAATLVTGNAVGVRADLSTGALARYDAAQRARDAQIRAAVAAGTRSLVVDPLPVTPHSYYPFDLHELRNVMPNKLVAAWYGLDDIAARPAPK